MENVQEYSVIEESEEIEIAPGSLDHGTNELVGTLKLKGCGNHKDVGLGTRDEPTSNGLGGG